jgi:hypothetical protein
MTKYEMEMEIPMTGDVAHFIEALREFGHPKIVLRVETDEETNTKHKLAAEVSNSMSSWWGNYYLSTEWFENRLKAIRGKRAQEQI